MSCKFLLSVSRIKLFLLCVLLAREAPAARENPCAESVASFAAGIGRKLDSNTSEPEFFAVCAAIPDTPEKSIVAMAAPHGDAAADQDFGGTNLDLDVAIVDSESGEIEKRFHESNALSSDADQVVGLSIDTARYQLTPGLRAFGVRVNYRRFSHIDPADREDLYLFFAQGKSLSKVLNGLTMAEEYEEKSGNCDGTASQSRSVISVLGSKNHGYFDLLVKSTTTEREFNEKGEDCTDKVKSRRSTHKVLRFDGTSYSHP
jgi:hypothetical protein